jgi:hypothetical protein
MSTKNLYFPYYASFGDRDLPMSSFDENFILQSNMNDVQSFFGKMIQLEPEENLMGETGRETNGFRLTTEDEPDGVDHDCFLSLRSDHIAAIGLQSGKQSPSISEVFFGGWDSSNNLWGTEGAIRLEATTVGARPRFSFLCNYGSLYFNNIVPDATLSGTFTAQPALTLESVSALVLKDRVVNKLPDEAEDAAGFYSQSGIPYAFDGSGNTYNMTSIGTGLTPSGGPYTITGDWTINGDWTFGSSTGHPELPATTTFTQSTGTAPFQVSSTTVVANLKSATTVLADNSTLLNSQADTVFAKLGSTQTITQIWTYDKQLKLTDITAPTGLVPTGYGYLYNSGKKIYWRDEDENNYDLATSNVAEDLYYDTATVTDQAVTTLRTIDGGSTPKMLAVEYYFLCTGTSGDFLRGSAFSSSTGIFYWSDSSNLVSNGSFGSFSKANKGDASSVTIQATTSSLGSTEILMAVESNLSDITIKVAGYSSGGTFSFKVWTRVYSV